MNKENMKKLRTAIGSSKNPVDLNMAVFFRHNFTEPQYKKEILDIVQKHSCGTAACLAGHAMILALKDGSLSKRNIRVNIEATARTWLGLKRKEAHDLFYGYWSSEKKSLDLNSITKKQAVAELTRLIDAEAT